MPTTVTRRTLDLAGLDVPFVEAVGAEDGPLLTVIAGVHGCEYVSDGRGAGVDEVAGAAGDQRPGARGAHPERDRVPGAQPVRGPRGRQEPQPVLPRQPRRHAGRAAGARRFHPAHHRLRRRDRRALRRHGRGPGAVRAVRGGRRRGRRPGPGRGLRAGLHHPAGGRPGPGGLRHLQRRRRRGRHRGHHRRGRRLRHRRAVGRGRARPRPERRAGAARHGHPGRGRRRRGRAGRAEPVPVAALRAGRLVGADRRRPATRSPRARSSARSPASTEPGSRSPSPPPRTASSSSRPAPPPSPTTASCSASAPPSRPWPGRAAGGRRTRCRRGRPGRASASRPR